LIAAGSLAVAMSCGSVAIHPDGGGMGGSSAGGAGGGAGGGAIDSSAGGTGGAGGGSPSDGGVTVQGGLGPIGPAPAASGSIRVVRAHLQPSPTCNGNICVSGGLIP
jgi:hypothetical protein